MTTDDLDKMERALGFPLPAFYRRFMEDYPRWLSDKQPEWLGPVTKWELADDPDRVIEFNQYVRAQAPGEFVDDAPWPDEHFVIGNEADQNWFSVNRQDGSEAVYFYSHEDGEFHVIAESLQGYTEFLVRWWEDIRRDAE